MTTAGRFVLITGASSGLGVEFARQLAADGENLLLTARSEPKLHRLAEELSAAHKVDVRVVPSDLSTERGARELCAAVDALNLPVEHLINNAGYGGFGPFQNSDPDAQRGMVRVNCEALVVLSRHFLPPMLARSAGGIMQVASIAGFQAFPYMTTYAASKAFVVSFSLGLAAEVRGTGVTVCCVCPGPVPTNFRARAGSPDTRKSPITISPEVCVRESLAAYRRGTELFVPGTRTRLGAGALRLLPRLAAVRATSRLLRKRYGQGEQP